MLGVFQEGLERLARGPLDEHHGRARLHVRPALLDALQLAEGHDPAAVLAYGVRGPARVLPVEVVVRQVEEVERV